ncbi:MAG: hypothetical protein U0264_03740 [Candidatus Kapaibacterium sp.]
MKRTAHSIFATLRFPTTTKSIVDSEGIFKNRLAETSLPSKLTFQR